jgi:hypothetical protein
MTMVVWRTAALPTMLNKTPEILGLIITANKCERVQGG